MDSNITAAVLLTTLISLSGLARGEVECTADLLELVGEEVMGCVRRQQQIGGEAGAVFSGAVYREEGVCIMIHRIVHKCGNMWRNCYTDTEVSGRCPSVHQFIHLRYIHSTLLCT